MITNVLLIGSWSPLVEKIVKNISDEKVKVFVLTENTDDWKNTGHITILDRKYLNDHLFQYAIVLFKENLLEKVKNVEVKKVLFLHQKDFKQKNDAHINVQTILVGDLYGPGVEHYHKSNLTETFKEAQSGEIRVPESNPIIYPVYVDDAAKELVHQVFAFNKETPVIGERINFLDFAKRMAKVSGSSIKFVQKNFYENGFSLVNIVPRVRTTNSIARTLKSSKSNPKKISQWIISLLIIGTVLITPLAANTITMGTVTLAYEAVSSGHVNSSKTLFQVSSVLSKVSLATNTAFTKTFLDNVYKKPLIVAQNINGLVKLGLSSISIIEDFNTLSLGLQGKKDYKVQEIAQRLSLELESTYNELSFLEADFEKYSIISSSGLYQNLISNKSQLIPLSTLAQNLPQILGEFGEAKHLVLLQDNTQLRAQGGKIEYVIILTFEKGVLINSRFIKASEIDSNLGGYVDAPLALKTYTDSNTWSIKDANWGPVGESAAQRAKWFIDKSIDEQMDGVVFLNPALLKNYIYTDLESGNNKEEELKIFALNIVKPLSSNKSKETFMFLQTLLTGIKENNFQFITKLTDKHFETKVAGWVSDECTKECTKFITGTIESNLGQNSSITQTKRNSLLQLVKSSKAISAELTVNFEFQNEGRTYLQAIAPLGSQFKKAIITDKNIKSEKPVEVINQEDFMTAGVFFENDSNSQKTIKFIWQTPLRTKKSRTNLVIKKQPGVPDYEFKITVENDSNLTQTNEFIYNSFLSEDFSVTF